MKGVIILFLCCFLHTFAWSQCTNLPIIKINTLGQNILDNVRITCDMGIIDNGTNQNCLTDIANNYDGKITIEYRGSSSQGFPKKPYGFSTVDNAGANLNVSLLGMPEENDWVLLNPYTDKSFMRDVIMFECANAMGWYASRTKFVELYINGSAKGIYVLLEKIKRDKNRVDIQKLDSTMNSGDALTGGYIFKIDKLTSTNQNYWTSPNNIDYLNHYPDGDVITAQQNNYLHNYITSFENSLFNATFTSPSTGYRKFANVNSFVDYLILNEIANNVDGYRLSTFMHKDRDSKCGKFTMGPMWDNNLSFGNADYCNADTAGWRYVQGCMGYMGMTYYLQQMITDPYFANLLHCRWTDLRSNILHTDTLFTKIDSYKNLLEQPKNLDSTLWQTIGNYVWPNQWVANSWQGELDNMKAWIAGRMNWLDANMPAGNGNCNAISQLKVVIDEINYNSDSTLNAGDWIELYNYGTTVADISSAIITNGNNLESYCVIPPNTLLGPGQRLVVYEDSLQFATVHPTVTNKIGPLCFKLNNNGQRIEMHDSNNAFVYGVTYDDQFPWPEITDGYGRTLQLINVANLPNQYNSWKAGCVGGSPGLPYSPCDQENPIITEVNYNAAITSDAGDWFELYNKSNSALNVGGYKIKVHASNNSYTIPNGVNIPANSYLIIHSNDVKFNAIYPFAINKSGPTNLDINNTKEIFSIYSPSGILNYSLLIESSNGWPALCNGTGRTLDNLNYTVNQNAPTTWIDGCLLGSPGAIYDPGCKPLSVSTNQSKAQIDLYPNPASQIIYLHSSVKLQEISLFDVTGKIRLTSHETSSIHVESLLPGMYYLKLQDDEGNSYIKHFIKE